MKKKTLKALVQDALLLIEQQGLSKGAACRKVGADNDYNADTIKRQLSRNVSDIKKIENHEALIEYANKMGFPVEAVSSYWLKENHISVNIRGQKNEIDYLSEIKNILAEYNPERQITLTKHNLKETKALKASISDMHVGLEPNPSNKAIFAYQYNEQIFKDNLQKVFSSILKEFNSNGVFDLLIIDDLGDGLDGWNGLTTRGGHKLDQNMNNENMFRVFVEGKLELIENCIKAGIANKIIVRNVSNDNHCYANDVEVLTNEGWKFYHELSKNELIATYNNTLNKVEYQVPSDYIYNEPSKDIEIHNYKSRSSSIAVTSNHRMYAKKLSTGRLIPFEYEYILSKDLLQSSFKFKSSFNNDKDDYDISDNLIRLCAWINTDGTVKRNGYSIYQAKENGIKKLEILFKELGILNVVKNIKKSTPATHIRGVKIKSHKTMYEFSIVKGTCGEPFLAKLRGLVPQKSIPSWVWKLSKRQFDIFLSSFIDGDGTRKLGVTTATTIYGTKKMLDDLQELCILNNHRTVLSKNNRGDFVLCISFNRDFSDLQQKNKTILFNKPIYTWCLTLPNSNMIVRHNGKVSLQGNSSSFASIANMTIQMILNKTYNNDDVSFYILNKFIEHFEYGEHTFILTHGKDSQYMFKGLPYELNDKATAFINDYIDHFDIRTKFIHLEKGDLHRVGYSRTKKFDYRNFMSFAPPSAWVQHNFGDCYSGYSIQVINKDNGEIAHTDYYFDLKKQL